MKSFLIIRAGKTFTEVVARFGEFEDFFSNAFINTPENINIIDAQNGTTYPDEYNLNGIIITGAHENVTEHAPWMNGLKSFIKKCHNKKIPILGVCFGHQIIAEALGGKVSFNQNGGEFGLVEILAKNSFIAFGYKFANKFPAFVFHQQSVTKLPQGSTVLASSKNDTNQIIHFGNKSWGLQFHPEFTTEITQLYLNITDNQGQIGNIDEQKSAKKLGEEILTGFVNFCTK